MGILVGMSGDTLRISPGVGDRQVVERAGLGTLARHVFNDGDTEDCFWHNHMTRS